MQRFPEARRWRHSCTAAVPGEHPRSHQNLRILQQPTYDREEAHYKTIPTHTNSTLGGHAKLMTNNDLLVIHIYEALAQSQVSDLYENHRRISNFGFQLYLFE